MEFNYAPLQNTAERLIRRYGKTGTLTQEAASGDAWNPSLTPSGDTVRLATFNYNESQVDGTVIRQGDLRAIVSTEGLTVTPSINDRVTVDSVDYKAVNVAQLKPAGTVLYWDMQLRR